MQAELYTSPEGSNIMIDSREVKTYDQLKLHITRLRYFALGSRVLPQVTLSHQKQNFYTETTGQKLYENQPKQNI